MVLSITSKCVSCDICRLECPNQAISMNNNIYNINIDLCTECIGYYNMPNCQRVCPIPKAILKNPNLY